MYSHRAFSLHGGLSIFGLPLFKSVSFTSFSVSSKSDVVVELNSTHKLMGRHLRRPWELSALNPSLHSPIMKNDCQIGLLAELDINDNSSKIN